MGSEGERLYDVSLIIIIKARVSWPSEAILKREKFPPDKLLLTSFLLNQLQPSSNYNQTIAANNSLCPG